MIINAKFLEHIIEVKKARKEKTSIIFKILLFLLSSKLICLFLTIVEYIIKIILILPIPFYADLIKMFITYLPGTPHFLGNYLRVVYYSHKLKFLGKNVIIDQGVIILYPENVEMDTFVWIDKNVILGAKSMKIGKRVHIAQNVVISGGGSFSIGDYSAIAHSSAIVTSTDVPQNGYRASGPMVPFEQRRVVEEEVRIGKDVFIAMGARILPGVEIGDGVVIGVNSLVKKNVPPWTVVFGSPARRIGQRERVKYPDPD